jgi:hypothetical protein
VVAALGQVTVSEASMNFSPRKPSGKSISKRMKMTAVLAVFLGAACSGNIDGGNAPAGNPGDKAPGDKGGPTSMTGSGGSSGNRPQDPPPPPATPAPAGTSASVAPLRRLNADQYKNTVQDLLGLGDLVTQGSLPPDEAIGDERFVSNTRRPVQSSDVDRYSDLAELIARKAVTAPGPLLGCDLAGSNEASCVAGFIERFGKRAFRRPLTPAEIDRAKEVFTAGKTGADALNGIRLVVQAFLQTPSFLYLVEPTPADAGGKVVAMDAWSMASRLSYFLLNSMPDDDLFKAAGDNQLGSPEQIGTQAQRLMGTQRFRDMVATFHSEWLETDMLRSVTKSETAFPAWNEELRAAMLEEPRRFVEYVMREGDGKLETLLTAPYSVLSGPLYDFYGVAKPTGAGADWKKVDLDPKQRAGLFTQAGIMASLAGEERTSFIRRGKLVRAGLLCTPVPDPPPGIDATEVTAAPTANARERAKVHRDKPECAACHALFDPLGFPFEAYDAIGKYRTMESGKAVDTTTDVTITRSLNGPVKDAIEMLGKMAKDDEVRECVARQWLRFALGRDEVGDDKASLDAAVNGFKSGEWKITNLLAAIARSDSFRFQKVTP